MDPYVVDNNTVKWSGFYKTEEEAEACLKQKVELLSTKKKIVSAKKELQVRKPHNELLHKLNALSRHATEGMLLYKFTVILAPKEDKA